MRSGTAFDKKFTTTATTTNLVNLAGMLTMMKEKAGNPLAPNTDAYTL
jgi:hypothetical protein